MPVVVGVLKETAANETRVAVVPEIAGKLKAQGARVLIERGAGLAAHFADADGMRGHRLRDTGGLIRGWNAGQR